jgi:hypothetical protein
MSYTQRGDQWECALCGLMTSSIGRAEHHNQHLQQMTRQARHLGKGSVKTALDQTSANK